MPDPLTIVLPWSTCYASKNDRHAGKRPFSHNQRYRSAIQHIHAKGVNATARKSWPKDSSYLVSIKIYPPDWIRRDAQNIIAVVMDGLEGAVYEDDYQARHGRWEMCEPDRENPRIVVEVTQVAEEAA